MKKLTLIFLLVTAIGTQAQNNGIFDGGSKDGHAKAIHSKSTQNAIYGGLTNDGHAVAQHSQGNNNGIFAGGVDDGHSVVQYSKPTHNDIFAGGNDDGHAMTQISQDNNNGIFAGGNDDGFDVAQISKDNNNGIFAGGEDDGHDVFIFVGIPLILSPPFPIELLSFDAWPYEGQVHIEWVTTHEVNLDRFVIERSKDGLAFEVLSEVPGKGGPEFITPYETADPNPMAGRSYYRLKSLDQDGGFEYSRMVEVHFDQEDGLMITAFPNPTPDVLNLRLSSSQTSKAILHVYDMAGRLTDIPSTEVTLSGFQQLSLDMGALPQGMYILQVIIPELNIKKSIKVRKY